MLIAEEWNHQVFNFAPILHDPAVMSVSHPQLNGQGYKIHSFCALSLISQYCHSMTRVWSRELQWCLYSQPWDDTESMKGHHCSAHFPVFCYSSLYSHTDCLLDMYIKVFHVHLKRKLYFGEKGNKSDVEWKTLKKNLYSYSLFIVHFFQCHRML